MIQRAFRNYKSKKQDQDDGIDWKQAAKRTIGILDKLRVPKEELDRAATLIKVSYILTRYLHEYVHNFHLLI